MNTEHTAHTIVHHPPHSAHSPHENAIISHKFSQQKVDLEKTPLYFPEGYEHIFVPLYLVTLPYIAGILFLFFYVSKVSIGAFVTILKGSNFFLTWAIGYEIMATLALLWIVKMSIHFTKNAHNPDEDTLQKP